MRIVIDTSVLVAAIRSPTGAAAEIVRRVLLGEATMVASVPLFLEYESVVTRDEHILAANVPLRDVENLLDVLASKVKPVEIRFLWRPQLRDADDEMVLEAAVNGRADAIVTFNRRDFADVARNFGIEILSPAETIGRL